MSIFTTFTDDIILKRDNDEKSSKDINDRIQTVESYINTNMNGNIPTPTAINPLDEIIQSQNKIIESLILRIEILENKIP